MPGFDTMAEKFSIYAGPPLATVLVGYEDSRSARANQVADDWLAMVRELTPSLTAAEWAAVCDGLNSYYMGDQQSLSLAWATIDDQPELCEKWGIEHASLVRKLRALSDGQRRAMRETFERLWADMSAGVDHLEAVKRVLGDAAAA